MRLVVPKQPFNYTSNRIPNQSQLKGKYSGPIHATSNYDDTYELMENDFHKDEDQQVSGDFSTHGDIEKKRDI